MCTAQLSRQAAPTYKMADYDYEVARSFLDEVIAATITPAPRTVAAAVAVAAKPAAPLAVVKPAAKPAAAPVATATARRSEVVSPRLQKLATKQIAVGRYAFEHCGIAAEVANTAEGWRLTIAGTPGNRRYETKRHAVNAARLVMESQAAAAKAAPAPAKPAPAPIAKPAAAEIARPAPATAAPAPAARVNWRSEAAPWRKEKMTPKQARLLGHLYGKMTKCGLTANSPLASKAGLNRGEASDLIVSLKSQLGGYARTPRAAGTATEGCSIGPFNKGFCEVCGLVQNG